MDVLDTESLTSVGQEYRIKGRAFLRLAAVMLQEILKPGDGELPF